MIHRVCIVTEDASGPLDEGLKKFVASLAASIEPNAAICLMSTQVTSGLMDGAIAGPANKLMLGRELWHRLRHFQPDTCIYVPRAAGTRNAFVRAAALRLQSRSFTVMVSLQPRTYGPAARRVLRVLHPNLTVTQGYQARDELVAIGLQAIAIPSGVDTDTFVPVDDAERTRLRALHGVPVNKRVLLHVGHLRPERNLEALVAAAHLPNTHVVMAASNFTGSQAVLGDHLRNAGVQVIDTFLPRIAELYQLADLYVFPVLAKHGAIEMPLSVLEAMSSGLPVVTTRFGSLPDWLPDGPGLQYADDNATLQAAISSFDLAATEPMATRSAALQFSWDATSRRLLSEIENRLPRRQAFAPVATAD